MEKAFYDSELKCVRVKYSGYPTLEEFIEISDPIIVLLKQHGVHKIFNDTTQLVVNSEEIQEWTQNNWFPRAYTAGLTHLAFLLPENAFGQVSAEQTNEKAEDDAKVAIKYFEKESELKAWLKNA